MTRIRLGLFCLVIGAAFLLVGAQAHAERFSFDGIGNEGSDPDDVAIGEAQLFMDVSVFTGDDNQDIVLFDFNNLGPEQSSVNAVYFDFQEGVLFSQNTLEIINRDGVSFSNGSNPPNVPGGNDPLVNFTTTISADADEPPTTWGVNPGQSLGVTFELASGKNYSDVVSSLIASELRVGLHVIGFESGGSESFVNNPNPVPEPTTFLLLAPGLIGLALLGRRLKRT